MGRKRKRQFFSLRGGAKDFDWKLQAETVPQCGQWKLHEVCAHWLCYKCKQVYIKKKNNNFTYLKSLSEAFLKIIYITDSDCINVFFFLSLLKLLSNWAYLSSLQVSALNSSLKQSQWSTSDYFFFNIHTYSSATTLGRSVLPSLIISITCKSPKIFCD